MQVRKLRLQSIFEDLEDGADDADDADDADVEAIVADFKQLQNQEIKLLGDHYD